MFVNNGFDVKEYYIDCFLLYGKFLNVSIMGRSYIDDDEVIFVLLDYGEIKSEIICLKYKVDYKFVRFENGNRLVKMVLVEFLLFYFMKIGGEWCRSIYSNL